MKSYTDIKQSKKLAEILPLESADMSWYKETEMFPFELHSLPYSKHFVRSDIDDELLPCWSLATLLDYLAKKDCFPEVTYTGTCYLIEVNFYDDEEGNTVHPIHFIRTEGESLVDAAVEMILKLKEKDLI